MGFFSELPHVTELTCQSLFLWEFMQEELFLSPVTQTDIVTRLSCLRPFSRGSVDLSSKFFVFPKWFFSSIERIEWVQTLPPSFCAFLFIPQLD